MENTELLDASPDRRFDLRYTGGEVERTGGVPAAVLTQALEGLQRLVHLLAMRVEGRALNKRARPSSDIQQRFPVLCLPPLKGSYLNPTIIGRSGFDLLDEEEAGQISNHLAEVMLAANSGDLARLDKVVPDPTYRRFIFAALADMIPPIDSGIELEVKRLGIGILTASRMRPIVTKNRSLSTGQMGGVVTGFLFDINFEARQFGLYHPPSERKLVCTYDEDGESMLLDHPRDLIQVIGLLERDETGNLVKVVRVDEVLEIDVSSFHLTGFNDGDRRFRTNRPIVVDPNFEKEEQIFLASIPYLGIEAFAETRAELEGAIIDELRILWREYVDENDDNLAEDALILKSKLVSAFTEVAHAS